MIDCLRALHINNSSFEFVKLLLSSEVIEDVKEMKRLVEETGKVSKDLLVEFDSYLFCKSLYNTFICDYLE